MDGRAPSAWMHVGEEQPRLELMVNALTGWCFFFQFWSDCEPLKPEPLLFEFSGGCFGL